MITKRFKVRCVVGVTTWRDNGLARCPALSNIEYPDMPLIDQINVLAELQRVKVKYDFAGNEYVKILCPFHDDTTPSCSVNTAKRFFKCMAAGCAKTGDIITLLAAITRLDRATVALDIMERYGAGEQELHIAPHVIEGYHAAIWQAGPLLAELRARGVTDDMIRQYRLGVVEGRVAIPIKSVSGEYVNVRKYLPGAPGAEKMRNVRGHSTLRLYPIEQMQYASIVLCGGEIKAIVAAAQLNPHGVGAVTATGGEGVWHKTLTPQFDGKTVWVCMDVDEAGRKATQTLCRLLHRAAGWVGDLVLPLDVAKYPKGDINDYIAQEGGQLFPLLEHCPQWQPGAGGNAGVLRGNAGVDDAEAESCTVGQAVSAKYVGRRVEVQAVVSTCDLSPYSIPKQIEVVCDKNQDYCGVCAIHSMDPPIVEIAPESEAIVDMVGKDKGVLRLAMFAACGIPQCCKVCELNVKTYHHIEDCRISPQLEITNRAEDRTMQPALCVLQDDNKGQIKGLAVNDCYVLTGRMYPHPANQRSTLLISDIKPSKDALSIYAERYAEHAAEYADSLAVFCPTEWSVEAVGQRLDAIYSDFEANVTRIYQRKMLHLTVDLVYHSPLFLNFDGVTVKGWTDILVLGDTAQGKSEVACGATGNGGLMRHYQLGERMDCSNATRAGILGGCQQLGTRWFVQWGVIPTHDQRLVILEELKKVKHEVIGSLTDMRSSGVAELPKIEKRRTRARTRLLSISNPKSEQGLDAYNFGLEAVKELIGSPEDIRRFDMVLLVSRNDVDGSVLNIALKDRPHVPHVYTTELCQRLVLWAWTRTAEQVIIDEATTDLILRRANQMCELFTDEIPIVDRGSMRLKLARLAAALAARTFCADESGEQLIVLPCHVDYIADRLIHEYSRPVFGYREYTVALQQMQHIEQADVDVVRRWLLNLPHPAEFVREVLAQETLDIQAIQDLCGFERLDAQRLLSVLIRKRALVRDGREYRKTVAFIAMLKAMVESGELANTGKPDFMPDSLGGSLEERF